MPVRFWFRRRLGVLHARATPLAAFVTLATGVALLSCVPPAPRHRPLVTRMDLALDSEAREKGPAWRADHFPAADLHGPFARPELPDTSADRNDAMSYFRLADSVKHVLPGLADRAFYWALRLDPALASAYFARWDLLRRRFPWRELPDGTIRRIYESDLDALRAVDSLRLNAISHNPFTPGTFEVPMWIMQLDPGRVARDPTLAGMRAYAGRDFQKAVVEWAKALRKNPNAVMLHLPRAHAWVRLEQPDSAIAELNTLADRIEAVQRDSLTAPYFSRDFLYYSIGMLQAKQGRVAEARAAYEKALVENLGMYMAHFRLSAAAVLTHDTALALNELEMAKLIRPDDPWVLLYKGSLLRDIGQLDDAERELRAALRLNSDFALPHLMLGLVADARGDTATSRVEYTTYLARASRGARERDYALDRLAIMARH